MKQQNILHDEESLILRQSINANQLGDLGHVPSEYFET